MTASRILPTLSTDPGGASGADWTVAAKDSVAALWGLSGGMLASVSGTNSLTASVAVSDGFTVLGDGQEFTLVPPNTNTGPMEINIGGLGLKAIVDQDGGALAAGAMIAGRAAVIKFFAAHDHHRVIGSGGDSFVTVTGGLQLQRSAPSRAVADAGPFTALTALASVNMQTQAAANRVVIEGNVSRMVGAGVRDTAGTVIALYVDGAEAETFTDWCEPDRFMSTPFAFEYLPGDTASHSYQIRASSVVSATYPAGSNWMVATEMSPNA